MLLFPLTSASIMCMHIKDAEKLSLKTLKHKIRHMGSEEYIERAVYMHQLLNNDEHNHYINTLNQSDNYDIELQRIKSCKQPCSTTKVYATLMKGIHQDNGLLPSHVSEMMRNILNRTFCFALPYSYLKNKRLPFSKGTWIS